MFLQYIQVVVWVSTTHIGGGVGSYSIQFIQVVVRLCMTHTCGDAASHKTSMHDLLVETIMMTVSGTVHVGGW